MANSWQSISSRIVPALQWSYAGRLTAALLQVIYVAIMARLLAPQVFGVVAVCNTVIRFAQFFSEMGVSSSIIQKSTLSTAEKTAFFHLALGANIVLAALIWGAAPWLVLWVPGMTAQAIAVLRALSLVCILNGAGHTGLNLLRRDLNFKYLNLISLLAQASAQFLVGLPLAFCGGGVWSLVCAALAQGLVTLVLVAWRRPHGMRAKDLRYRGIAGLSLRFSLMRLIEALLAYLPALGVAFFLGVTATGLFDRAFALVILPLDYFSSSLSGVLFPVFSRFRSDQPAMQMAFGTAMVTAMALILPTVAGMAAAGDALVTGVLGSGFARAAAFMPAITLYVGLVYLGHFLGVTVDGLGKIFEKTLLQGGVALGLIGAALVLRPASVPEILALAAMAELIRSVGLALLAARGLGLSPAALLKFFYPALPGLILVFAGIKILVRVLPAMSPAFTLCLSILAGALLLAAGLVISWRFFCSQAFKVQIMELAGAKKSGATLSSF